jgi:branched-chain amino acid transport system substrate-binding protein
MIFKRLITQVIIAAAVSLIGTQPPAGAELAIVTPTKCGLSNGKKATGAPILLGAVVSKTGADDFSSSGAAAAAYFSCVNDNGGINGRRVDYAVMDDQWNPEVAAQVASKLVKDRKVVALVGNTSFVECGANARLYADEGVMAIAGTGVPRECFNARNYVPVNSGPRVSSTIVAMYAVKAFKSKKMVCIVPNIPGLGNWACEGPKEWAKKNGVVMETVTIDPDSADATSTMLQVAAKKPDTIIICVPKGLLVPLLAAAEQQNMARKFHFVSAAPAYDTGIPQAIGAYWNDALTVNLEFTPLESRGSDNLNWLAVMARYGTRSDPRDTFSQAGYLAARVVTETLLKMDPAKINRATVTAALRNVSNFRSDILCAPFYVGNGNRHNANSAGPMVVVHGTGFSALPGGCIAADDPELSDIRADEKKLGMK